MSSQNNVSPWLQRQVARAKEPKNTIGAAKISGGASSPETDAKALPSDWLLEQVERSARAKADAEKIKKSSASADPKANTSTETGVPSQWLQQQAMRSQLGDPKYVKAAQIVQNQRLIAEEEQKVSSFKTEVDKLQSEYEKLVVEVANADRELSSGNLYGLTPDEFREKRVELSKAMSEANSAWENAKNEYNTMQSNLIMLKDFSELSLWPEEDVALLKKAVIHSSNGIAPTDMTGALALDELTDKYGRETIDRVKESYSWYLNSVNAQKVAEAGQKNAGLFDTASSIPISIFGSITGAADQISYTIGEKFGATTGRYPTMDPNLSGYLPSVYAENVIGSTAKSVGDWAEATAKIHGYSDKVAQTSGTVASTVFKGSVNALENLTRLYVAGPSGSLALAGVSSFNSEMRNSVAKGASTDQAFAMGIASAGLEILTEKIPLDNLMDNISYAMKNGIDPTSLLANVAKQTGTELVTEELNYLGGIFAQAAILREKSDYQQRVTELMNTGMTREQARDKADREVIEEAAMLAGETIVSSALMTGVTSGKAHVDRQRTLKELQQIIAEKGLTDAESAQALIESGMESDPTTDSYKLAVRLKAKLDSGKELTSKELSRLWIANEEAIRAEQAQADQEGTQDNETEQQVQPPTGLKLPTVNGTVAEEQAQAPTTELTLPTVENGAASQDVNVSPELQQQAQVAEGARMEQTLNGGNQNGITYEQSQRTGPAGQTAGAGVLHGSSQWNAGQSAAESAGGLAGGTGTAAPGTGAAVDRLRTQNERNNLGKHIRQTVSASSLGVAEGTDRTNLKVIPEELWDDGMRVKAEQIYQETGKPVTYVLGAIECQNKNGTFRVQGVITNQGIVVRANHSKYTPEQIADHEGYHGMVDVYGQSLNAQIVDLIKQTFSEEEFNAVLDRYIVSLRNVIDVNGAKTGEEYQRRIEQIMEEILADAYAGMNAWGNGATQFTETVNQFLEENYISRPGKQDNGVRETAGPPTDSYSVEDEYDEQAFKDRYGLKLPTVGDSQKENTAGGGVDHSVEQKTGNDYLRAANLTEAELQSGITVQQFIDKVSAMINKAIRSKRKLRIGPVSQQHASVVNDIIRRINPSFSADDYELWIDGTGATHIEDRHGINGKQDKSMASDEAKMLIPWASQNASGGDFLRDNNGNIRRSVRFFNRDQSRAPEIFLEKQIDNDTIYVSECVPDSEHKRIWITSAYIKKGSNGQMLNMEENSPQLTPEAPFDGNATTGIVTSPTPTVKQQFSKGETGQDYLVDEEYDEQAYREQYGLKLPTPEKSNHPEDKQHYSVDDGDEVDFDQVEGQLAFEQQRWKEMYLKDRLGEQGYKKYRQHQEQKEEQQRADRKQKDAVKRKVKSNQQKLHKEYRDSKADADLQKRLADASVPTQAKKDLRVQLMNLFSTPDGRRAELGKVIDGYADRLIKSGELTDADRKAFFDRMYEAGVMTVPADEYYALGRSAITRGKIYVGDSIRADFGDDWNDFRRRAFAAGVYLTNNKADPGIDVWNDDLSYLVPGLFDSEDTELRGILERIVQVAEEGKDEHVSLAEYTAQLAERDHVREDDVLDSMERQMDWALRAFAEMAGLEIKLKEKAAKEQAALKKENVRRRIQIQQERQEHKDATRRHQEQQALRELQQKTLKSLQWLNKNRHRAPEELKAAFDEVLSDIDIYAVGAANEMNWSDKYGATWKDLAQMYKDDRAQNGNFLPNKELERICDRLDSRKIEELDVEALNDLYRMAVGLRTAVYNRRNVINDERHRLFADVYADATQEIKAAPGGFTGNVLDKFFNMEQLTPMNFLQRLGGWDPNGTIYSLAKQLERGERDMRAYKVKSALLLEEFLKNHEDWVRRADGQGKDGIWYKIEVPELMELGMGDKPIFGKTITVYETPMQRVHRYLESKNYDNLLHIAGGRTFVNKELYSQGKRDEAFAQGTTVRMAPETVKISVSDLTAEELELAQILERDYYNGFSKKEVNRVSNIVYGYDKTINNNYAPIYTNQSYTSKDFGIFDDRAEHVGSLKERIKSKTPSYNISALDAFERHVDRTSRFVGMAIPTQNWETFWCWREGNDTTKSNIDHKWGKEANVYIENIINMLQGSERETKGWLDKLTDKGFGHYISAVFGFNPSIVMKQLGSIPMAGAYLGMRNMPNPKQVHEIDRNLISLYTQELGWRLMGYSSMETKELKDNPTKLQRNKAYRFMTGGAITAMDGWAASTLWPWAENKVRKEHPDLDVGTQEQIDSGESPFYKKVAEEFESAVWRSQSVSDEMHQSNMRKSKGTLSRALTLFRSDSAQAYNAIRQKIGEAQFYAKQGQNEQAAKAARLAVGSAFLALALNAIGTELWSFVFAAWKHKDKKYRDEEGKLTWESAGKEAASNILSNLLGTVVGAEELAEIIGALFTGEKWYELDTPGLSQLNDMIETIVNKGGHCIELVKNFANVVENGGDAGAFIKRHWQDLLGGIKTVAETMVMYFPGLPVANVEAYLLGTVKWLSPELGTEYEDLLETATKSGLNGLHGDALSARVGNILDNRSISQSDDTAQVLADLYAAGFKDAIPSNTPTNITIDGEEHELEAYQQQAYDNIWSSIVAETLDVLVDSDQFQSADQERQTKMLKTLYNYASDQAKHELFEGIEPSGRADDITAFKEAGLDMVDFLRCYAEYTEINSKDLKASQKATELAKWVYGQEYQEDQNDVILECLSYFNMTPATADKFNSMIEGGLDTDDAYDLTGVLDTLEPLDGADKVTDVQRWRVCVDFTNDAADQLTALMGVMTEAQYAKAELANKFGVDPNAYVTYHEIRSEFDANSNGSYSQKEVTAAIDCMDLSKKQKAALWQVVTGSKSAKSNPYSSQVGQQVLDAKSAEGEKEEKSLTFQEEVMRQLTQNWGK